MDEVREVLSRPRVRAKFARLSDALVEQLLAALLRKATYFAEVPRTLAFA